MSTLLDEAIKEIEKDYKFYKKTGNMLKIKVIEYILSLLEKQRIQPVPKKLYKKDYCYECGSKNQKSNYCSECGKRLK